MRTWTDPAVRRAEDEMHRARRIVARAETWLEHVLEDRRREERDIAEMRARGLEPWYRPRVAKPTPADLHAEKQAGERTVRFWSSDEEIEKARQDLTEAETRLRETTQKFETAKANAQPLDDEEQQRKAKRSGGYQAVRRIRLGGRTFEPGEVVPKSAVADIAWPKLEGWLSGRNPTLRKV